MRHGLLTKATHDYSLRLAPALLIKESEIKEAAKLIKAGIADLEKLNKEKAATGQKKSHH
jgi:acetylornithine/succinyldiaminopimelate/putrescine aminotransferase